MCSTEEGWGEEGVDWWHWKLASRKPWQCYECHQLIPVGEPHYYTFNKPSPEWDAGSYRTHVACEMLRDFVRDVVCGGEGYVPYGGLDEEICEAGEYLEQDLDAWEEAGLEVPNPLVKVFDEIIEHYKAKEAR